MSYRATNWLLGAALGFVVAALVASCEAGAHGPDLNHPAVKTASERTVQVLAMCDDRKTGFYGAGIVAGTETVVTARHVLAQPGCSSGPVLVLDNANEPVATAEPMAEVPGADIVILRTPDWARHKEIVCLRAPVEGEHVITVGYPGKKHTRTVTEGKVGKLVGPYQQEFSAHVEPGNSGGGVWTDDQCLVGIVSLYHVGDHTGVMVPVAIAEP